MSSSLCSLFASILRSQNHLPLFLLNQEIYLPLIFIVYLPLDIQIKTIYRMLSNYHLRFLLLVASIQLLGLVLHAQAQEQHPEGVIQKFWTKMLDVAQKTIAPQLEYVRLAARYRDWHKKYNAIAKPPMRDAREALQLEYAKVEDKLMKEVCRGTPATTTQNDDLFTFDHVFQVLKLMINNLELELQAMMQDGGEKAMMMALFDKEGNPEENQGEEMVKVAMDRIRNSLITTARNYALIKVNQVAIIALEQRVGDIVAEQQKLNPESPMALLGPIISMIGTVSAPVLSTYLTNIETRAAMGAINALNPMELACKLKPSNIKTNGFGF